MPGAHLLFRIAVTLTLVSGHTGDVFAFVVKPDQSSFFATLDKFHSDSVEFPGRVLARTCALLKR